MKIKVIDLFNNISNNKPVPSKIKISNYIYHFDINESTYTRFINNDLENPRGLLEDINLHNAYVWFNLEVKIIEEKPKKIGEIGNLANYKGNTLIGANMWTFYYKLNELTKAVNYLLEKRSQNE